MSRKKFIVGSAGSGNVGPLTYCADCYPNVSKAAISDGGESEKVAEDIVVDLTHVDKKQKQDTIPLLSKKYGSENDNSENDDGPPFRNPRLLFDHLSVVNAIDGYSAEFSVKTTSNPGTKNLSYSLLPKNSLMAHTLQFVCTTILRPLLYW